MCVILGGGGHARVLIDCMQAAGIADRLVILDQDGSRWGHEIQGVPILGGDDLLSQLVERGMRHFAVGVGSTGDNGPRRRLFELGVSLKSTPVIVVHPHAVCSRSASIGPGAQLFAGSIVNAGAAVGANVIVNTGAIIEHDCVVGDHAHIATGARLSGTVRVGFAAHVGAGATVRQCITIGDRAIVGAGAVVVDDVEPGSIVAGVPARPFVATQCRPVRREPSRIGDK